jgi:ABC-type multidrug transport system fused ATPase/permease subunit
MSKKLQIDSKYDEFDIDHDGVVSDEELNRSEKMLQIENMDKLADQQRLMAWAALFLPFLTIIFMALPFVSSEKVNLIMGLATTFSAAMGTIVVAFMAATAYIRGGMNKENNKE